MTANSTRQQIKKTPCITIIKLSNKYYTATDPLRRQWWFSKGKKCKQEYNRKLTNIDKVSIVYTHNK